MNALRAQLAEVTTDPYYTLAQEIRANVAARLANADDQEADAVMVAELAAIEERLVLEGLRKRFDTFEPDRILEIYAARLGDESVKKLLVEKAQLAEKYARRNLHITDMQLEAQHLGHVNLAVTLPNDRVVFGLFKSNLPDVDKALGKDEGHKPMSFRRLPYDGRGVLFEKLGGRSIAIDPSKDWSNCQSLLVHDHERLYLGGTRTVSGEPDAVVSRGSGLTFMEFEGRRRVATTAMEIGYITVNGIPVLDYSASK